MSGAQTGSNAGTITMYADQQAVLTEDYSVPTGGKLVAGTETIDDPTLVSVSAGTLTLGGGYAATQAIIIQGLGTVGTTVVHFGADGGDVADITVALIARPLETISVSAGGAHIQDTPAAPTT